MDPLVSGLDPLVSGLDPLVSGVDPLVSGLVDSIVGAPTLYSLHATSLKSSDLLQFGSSPKGFAKG